jgi:branched-subunit amino acid aminotransferase/4-amino-4-deoxychorismate lyase
MEICEKLAMKTSEANITAENLKNADGIFVSLSSFGIVEVVAIGEVMVKRSPLVGKIQETYEKFAAAND